MDVFGEGFNGFPKLPILSPSEIPPPRLSQREKYGGLFYLGIAGLVVLIALVVIFIHGAWALRDVGAAVYILHDPRRPELDRVQAALRLSRDPRVDDAQRMAICLERELPDLARYLLAESISTDLVAADPRSYALAVARSAGWPDWLRLLLARRLTYAAERGYAIPRDALDELAGQADPMIALWATTARGLLAVGPDRSAALALEQASHVPGPQGELAARLLAAVRAPAAHRDPYLDDATTWLRSHYPPSAKVWEGWRESDGRLIRVSP